MAQVGHGGAHAVRRTGGARARGPVRFAGIMLVLVGAFHVAVAVATVAADLFLVVLGSYVFGYDVATWGWLHLVLGVLVAVAGTGLLTAGRRSRPAPPALAVLSAVAGFLFVPYQPLWSLLIIAGDVAVLWALTANRPADSP
ncbi:MULTISPECIES: hypothetical protein [unclassified Saccharopolyspora]|uniref:DUF7144 family membrane protein n=1 Tax=unclassified Saccharopolyspora TaxID=2646250 RepID=UPI001CD28792|nr:MULTISPECIES: hypothetical protein [unclassified Saccharopolyspora]MCA1195794.1 hypothetical protein [Saccharopolyspora sp. 6V]MCA1283178.1 hypothetical protein [Saccharopolyspora sp. 7B]